MQTACGPRCDVHGGLILGLKEGEQMHPFTVKGIEGDLLCCEECRPALAEAMQAKDWTQLPAGPLRETFAQANA